MKNHVSILIEKIREGEKLKTPEDRKRRLIRAKILDDTGNYHPEYFSSKASNFHKPEHNK